MCAGEETDRDLSEQTGKSWNERSAEEEGPAESRAQGRSEDDASSRTGEGSAAGRTSDLNAETLRTTTNTGQRWENGGDASVAAGGASGTDAGVGSDIAGTAGLNTSQQTPVWRHDDWSQRRKDALDDVRCGRVPDAYTPVIREYFDQKVN